MAIELIDDGTMDTVLRCSECGEEMRYTYQPDGSSGDGMEEAQTDEEVYNAWVDWCIEDATSDHVCDGEDGGDA